MADITILNDNTSNQDDKGFDARLKEERLQDQSKRAREYFAQLQNELDEIEGDLKDGLSYLDMKNDTLLSYMIDLCNIVLTKVRGETISGHASVERCVTYRIILEKIKAIDQRLSYQLNKVISLPEGASEEHQGINIENLDIEVSSDEDDDEEDVDSKSEDQDDTVGARVTQKMAKKSSRLNDHEDELSEDDEEADEFGLSDNGSADSGADEKDDNNLKEQLERHKAMADKRQERKAKKAKAKASRSDIYRPPKLRSVLYDEGNRDRRRRDHSDFYQDDDNVDIVEETRTIRDDERTRYEEEHYTRLPDSNPKKSKRKAKMTMGMGKGKKKFKGRKSGIKSR